MFARLSAFVLWALIAATAVFWGLRLAVYPSPAPAHAVAIGDTSAGRGDLTRLLGAAPVAAPVVVPVAEASSRFRLLGIMAPKPMQAGARGHGGLAVIAVDGKPARAYAVGSRIDADLVLRSVSMRTASIGPAQGAQSVLLEIPPLPSPAASTLPRVGSPVPPVASGPAATAVAPSTMPVYTPQPPAPPPSPTTPMQRDGSLLTQ